jgi:hypothetical protein
MQSFQKKGVLLLSVILLGYFIVSMALKWRTDYWVLADGQPSMALVTGMSWAGHGVVDYEYEVKGTRYTGRSQRNWREEKYRHVGIGGKSVVYISASHPWLSNLDRPEAVGIGWPVMLVALPMWFSLLMAAIHPSSKWAFGTRSEKLKSIT